MKKLVFLRHTYNIYNSVVEIYNSVVARVLSRRQLLKTCRDGYVLMETEKRERGNRLRQSGEGAKFPLGGGTVFVFLKLPPAACTKLTRNSVTT